MKLRRALVAASLTMTFVTAPLRAQSAAEHVALGDRDHAAMRAPDALGHYEAALRLDPDNAEALWRASAEAIDLGEFDDARRDSLYALGESYARRAVRAAPASSMAHFALAKAIGRKALSVGPRERVKLAVEVRAEALEALRLDSANVGALHVLGMWNANVMRLGGMARFFAKRLPGGRVFDEASWDAASGYLERAVALEPERIVHRLSLARIYADRGQLTRAREAYATALALRATDYNDAQYQSQATAERAKLR